MEYQPHTIELIMIIRFLLQIWDDKLIIELTSVRVYNGYIYDAIMARYRDVPVEFEMH